MRETGRVRCQQRRKPCTDKLVLLTIHLATPRASAMASLETYHKTSKNEAKVCQQMRASVCGAGEGRGNGGDGVREGRLPGRRYR